MNGPNAAACTAAPRALPRREAALWGKLISGWAAPLLPCLTEMYENPPTTGRLSHCLASGGRPRRGFLRDFKKIIRMCLHILVKAILGEIGK